MGYFRRYGNVKVLGRMSEKHRVWRVEMKDLTERIQIKPAMTEQQIRDLFSVSKNAKVYPIRDRRLKEYKSK